MSAALHQWTMTRPGHHQLRIDGALAGFVLRARPDCWDGYIVVAGKRWPDSQRQVACWLSLRGAKVYVVANAEHARKMNRARAGNEMTQLSSTERRIIRHLREIEKQLRKIQDAIAVMREKEAELPKVEEKTA